MYIKKNTVIVSLFVLGIVFFFMCFYIGFLKFGKHELKDFKILEFYETEGEVHYKIESNFYATFYQIILTDEAGNVLHDQKYEKNEGIIRELNLNYLSKIKATVIANHDNEIELTSENTIEFIWHSPSFNTNNNSYIEKNKDFNIYIDGDFTASKYKLKLQYNNELLREVDIDSGVITIPYALVSNYSGRISATIYSENNVKLANYNYYVNTVMVGNITITSPITSYISWENFIFSYEGGDNADSILLKIYKKTDSTETLSRTIGLTNNETEININYFEEDATYRLELSANYKDYEEISRTDDVVIKTGKKSIVKKVYAGTDFRSLKPGTKFTLLTNTEGAKIMYSTDGSDPVVYGKMYTEPIELTTNTTVTAVAIKENMANSLTSTFDVVVEDKVPVVYLSPSNQKSNPGVKSVGYTNEREMMNKVCDVLEKILKESGVIVYRNNPEDNMRTWLNTSRSVKSDLHFAIHSNGSVGHNVQGMEIYVHEESSLAYSLAQNIYNDLFEIYQRDGHKVGRGVLFARGRMGEVHPLNIPMGILIEVAYHDYPSDAKWIVDNINEIGESMANSILKYFQMM